MAKQWRVEKHLVGAGQLSKTSHIRADHPTDWTKEINIAEVYSDDHANLVAAAPDLLAALESALSLLKGHQETPEKKARYAAAVAAIAKAKPQA